MNEAASMKTLLLATHNLGKVKEFQVFLSGLVEGLCSAADYNLPEPEETGMTFTENALLKARAACKATGMPCLADDSGLAVDALGGAPGIYSARWAGPDKDFAAAMRKIHDELNGDMEGKIARFVAVLALVFPDGTEEVFEGSVAGVLTWPARGTNGFGYDPVFIPDGYAQTFGEMLPADKDTLSHRARAVEKLTTWLIRHSQKGKAGA